MHPVRSRCFAVHLTLPLLLLAALTCAIEMVEEDEDEDAVFAEFEEPDETSDEKPATTTTTTTSSRLQRHELPEDGFIWPTTDEEHFLDTLPDEHQCNGCKGIAFQIDKALKALMPKGKMRSLPEYEYTEAMECRTKIYDDYGLKKLEDKRRVLVGPGLPHTDNSGSVFGGAKWPTRMAKFCGNLVGDLGEEEVYRLWVDHGSGGFSEVLCSPSCGGGKRKAKKEEEDEDAEDRIKKKRRKKQPEKKKEEPSVEGPPEVIKVYKKKELKKLNKKHKFVFLLFCAQSFPRCHDLETQFELAARAARKSSDLKEMTFARADTDEVGTFDFELSRNVLPAFLLFRKGYAAPKGISPEEMLRLKESGDFLNYLQIEKGNFMQDDPDSFPRGKLEL